MSDNNFTPKNLVQKYAHENRSIADRFEFQRAIAVKPWMVKRVTAYNLWDHGVLDGSRVGIVRKLADFLKVKIDNLVNSIK